MNPQVTVTRRNTLLVGTSLAAAYALGSQTLDLASSPANAQPTPPEVTGGAPTSGILAQTSGTQKIDSQTLQRRAVDAAIWGMPIVAMNGMRQAFFRDAKANYGDVVYWSKPSDWKFQIPTPNVSVRYVYFNCNTRDGPVVIEMPPALGAGLFGSINDAWQTPLIDVGPVGEDQGRGGKYLVLPPDFKGEVPPGYIPVHAQTYNCFSILRAIPKSSSDADVSAAIELVKKLRVYPLANAGSPPETHFVDMTGKLFDAIARFDESFYASLAQMIDEEPVLARDRAMMGLMLPLGIERGKAFKPDAAMQGILAQSAREAHAWLMNELPAYKTPFWPDSSWAKVYPPAAPETLFTFERPEYLDVDARGIGFFSFTAPPVRLGEASVYYSAYKDAAGKLLLGGENYKLHVPPNPPAQQFWELTVYDLESCAYIREMPRAGIGSLDPTLQKNADGSVDVYIGPKPLAGKEANWLQTVPGHGWFPFFRLYAPKPSFFDKTWKLPEIEKAQ